MKLSITTIKILCSLWNHIEEVICNKDYLIHTIEDITNELYSIEVTEEEKQIAIKEIEELIISVS